MAEQTRRIGILCQATDRVEPEHRCVRRKQSTDGLVPAASSWTAWCASGSQKIHEKRTRKHRHAGDVQNPDKRWHGHIRAGRPSKLSVTKNVRKTRIQTHRQRLLAENVSNGRKFRRVERLVA